MSLLALLHLMQTNAYFVAELPVATTIICGAIGLMWRKLSQDNDRRDSDLARQSEALAILIAAQAPLHTRLDRVERRQQTLSEATAVLTATLEAHQAWHERVDRHHNRPLP